MFPIARRNNSNNLVKFDSLFDEFFKTPFDFGVGSLETMPAVDVYEKNNTVTVKVELAGVKPDELEVHIDNGLLTIRGEKKQENEVKERDYYRVESAYGRFERTVRLPQSVNTDAAKATYAQGILKIELPKSKEAKPKQLKIDVK